MTNEQIDRILEECNTVTEAANELTASVVKGSDTIAPSQALASACEKLTRAFG